MFETVLVAARGVAALRVVRTCQRLDVQSVAVHGRDDARAAHVRVADDAVPLGGGTWEESYGDARKLVEAARRAGAQAVHPGDGPLALDAGLARAVAGAGLVWAGDPPELLGLSPDALSERAVQAGFSPLRPDADAPRRLAVTVPASTPGRAVVRDLWPASGAPLLELTTDAEGLEEVVQAAVRLVAELGGGPLTTVQLRQDGAGEAAAPAGWSLVGLLPPLLAGAAAVEAALGLDPVELQLCAVAGDPLPTDGPRQHALVVHVRAAERFAGRLRRWRYTEVEGARLDSAWRQGDRITADSDRLLAVLTSRADAVGPAVAGARTALDGLEAAGLPTALDRVRTVLADPSSATGDHPFERIPPA